MCVYLERIKFLALSAHLRVVQSLHSGNGILYILRVLILLTLVTKTYSNSFLRSTYFVFEEAEVLLLCQFHGILATTVNILLLIWAPWLPHHRPHWELLLYFLIAYLGITRIPSTAVPRKLWYLVVLWSALLLLTHIDTFSNALVRSAADMLMVVNASICVVSLHLILRS